MSVLEDPIWIIMAKPHSERLARGNIEGVHHPERRRQHEDVPDAHPAGEREGRQRESQQHGGRLGGDDQAVAAVAVGHDASRGRQQEHRNLGSKPGRAQQHRRSREPVNQPRLRHILHPGADEGDELAGKEEPEIAVLEGAQGRRKWHATFIVRAGQTIAFGGRSRLATEGAT
jgi:CRISPR/Cas system endoribonuclease Cas6 (RAMP superfamily)